jgi:glycosyltransferase involved in cell wall biosynthesis
MTLRPSVSVIVPTYDYARYLPRALDSVRAQSEPPFEIVVVDDGSTDETPAVLRRYADQVRVLRQPHRGPAAARNAGVAAARGDLVAFLDADDEWHRDKLARQVTLFMERPSVGAVGCANQVIERDGAVLRTRYFPNPSHDPTERLRQVALRERWVGSSCSGAVLPRRVLEDVGGFDERLDAAEDWDLWLRVAARHLIQNVHERLVTIWFHREGVFRDAAKVEAAQWRVYRKATARWPDALDDGTRSRMRAMIRADAGGEYAAGGGDATALRRYVQSLVEAPLQPAVWSRTLGTARRLLSS